MGDPEYHAKCGEDQLNTIFDIIGTPTGDLSFIPLAERGYLKLFVKRPGDGLPSLFERKVDADSMQLLQSMLRFSPSERPSAHEALEADFLQAVRKGLQENETVAACPLALECDKHPALVEANLRKRDAEAKAQLQALFRQEFHVAQ